MSSKVLGSFPRTRLRRLRSSPNVRDLVRENAVTPSDLVMPLFVHDGPEDIPITSMPGQSRLCFDSLLRVAERAAKAGIKGVAPFPRIPDDRKTLDCSESYNPESVAAKCTSELKRHLPELLVFADVALDPYNPRGQDGLVSDTGKVLNDETNAVLVKQSLCQVRAGADVIAASDMMDGRIECIRDHLAANGCGDALIMAYSAKYASAFYGPFRDALDSAPTPGTDKKTYQMDPGNAREAVLEAGMDISEGADIVMVKPGMPYLDVVTRVKTEFLRPVAVYHVSGEYAMMKAAFQNGWLDERRSVLEAMMCFKRAGADIIFTYFATDAAEWLAQGA
eukprot:TRINITY_DN24568_c1_g1_i1.p1 TRINITY_DN24568_c1_g1~~TRINITY_DN24568_c1_g1_i1.p1  ORF type:complete len:336 (+),score=130.23 TRINITY_DN24568_c1_g1_i1:83-1090(+)